MQPMGCPARRSALWFRLELDVWYGRSTKEGDARKSTKVARSTEIRPGDQTYGRLVTNGSPR